MEKAVVKLFFVAAVTFVVPATCWAQFTNGCEARPSLGGAVSLWTIPMPVDPVLAATGTRIGLARGTGPGIEGSGHAVFPLNRTWSATAEFGWGRRSVEIYRLQDGTDVRVATGDTIRLRRYSVGVMARRASDRFVCLYTAFSAGPHWFEYRGASSVAVGVDAKIGVEVPTSEKIALYFDLGLNAIFNTKTKAPLADPVLAGLRPTLGMRYRFK